MLRALPGLLLCAGALVLATPSSPRGAGGAELARLKAQLISTQAAVDALEALDGDVGQLATPPLQGWGNDHGCDEYGGAIPAPLGAWACVCKEHHFCSNQKGKCVLNNANSKPAPEAGLLANIRFSKGCVPCGPDDDPLAPEQDCCACVSYSTLGVQHTAGARGDAQLDKARDVALELRNATVQERHGMLVGVLVGAPAGAPPVGPVEEWKLQSVLALPQSGGSVHGARAGGGLRRSREACTGQRFSVQQTVAVNASNLANNMTGTLDPSIIWLSALRHGGGDSRDTLVLSAGTRVSAVAPRTKAFGYYSTPCDAVPPFFMAEKPPVGQTVCLHNASGRGDQSGFGAGAVRRTAALAPAACTAFDFRVLVHSCEGERTGPTCNTTCGPGQERDSRHMVCVSKKTMSPTPPPTPHSPVHHAKSTDLAVGLSIAGLLCFGAALLWRRRREAVERAEHGTMGHRREDSDAKDPLRHSLMRHSGGGTNGDISEKSAREIFSSSSRLLPASVSSMQTSSVASAPASDGASAGGRGTFKTPDGEDDGYGDATGRWCLEVKAAPYQPLTNYLVDFEFGDGPLGLSFLKHHDGVFRVGSVLDTCKGCHISRKGRKLATETVDATAAPPAPVGSLKPCVGDRIVAVSGALVDDLMTLRLLGSLIRQARRPVVLTFEPFSMRQEKEAKGALIDGKVIDSVLLSSSDNQELADARSVGARGARLALTPAEMQQRKAQLKEGREQLAAKRMNMHESRQRDERILQERCHALLTAFDEEYRAKREVVKRKRDAMLEEGERELDQKYQVLKKEVAALQLNVTNLEAEVDPFYADGTSAAVPSEHRRNRVGEATIERQMQLQQEQRENSSDEASSGKKRRWFGRRDRRSRGSMGSGGGGSGWLSGSQSGSGWLSGSQSGSGWLSGSQSGSGWLWGRSRRSGSMGGSQSEESGPDDSDHRNCSSEEPPRREPPRREPPRREPPRTLMLKSGNVAKYTVGQRLQSQKGQSASVVAEVGVVVRIVADNGSTPPSGAGVVHLEFESAEVNPDEPADADEELSSPSSTPGAVFDKFSGQPKNAAAHAIVQRRRE